MWFWIKLICTKPWIDHFWNIFFWSQIHIYGISTITLHDVEILSYGQKGWEMKPMLFLWNPLPYFVLQNTIKINKKMSLKENSRTANIKRKGKSLWTESIAVFSTIRKVCYGKALLKILLMDFCYFCYRKALLKIQLMDGQGSAVGSCGFEVSPLPHSCMSDFSRSDSICYLSKHQNMPRKKATIHPTFNPKNI